MYPKSAQKPKRKSATAVKDNKDHLAIALDVVAKTEPQRQMIQAYLNDYNIVAHGSAGTGKSFVAVYLALKDLFEGQKKKIVIVRSAVATRDQGFLPGSLEEKSAVFAIPYKQIVNDLCQNGSAWEILLKKNMVEFVTTSYVRGITIDDAVVIIDEIQNCSGHEISSMITRVGDNCQLLICGDTAQNDLIKSKHDQSGFATALPIFESLTEWFECVRFTSDDIVRSGLVKAWVQACESA